MENEYENADSINSEGDLNPENEENQDGEPDLDALKESKKILSDKNRRLFERAKKSESEAKELREQLKKLAGENKQLEEKPVSQSNEPDYARLAYLETKGINHPDDQKIVQDEATRLKLPLTDILAMDHIKARLEINKNQRESMAGMPKGKGNKSGSPQNDIDYWLQKDETPDDQELAEKVIEARINKEKNSNKFSDVLYTD